MSTVATPVSDASDGSGAHGAQRAAVHAHPAYRPDIDGLRAVAVLSVIGFHAFPFRVPGGFVGVDIFFVISGYLITTIILGDLRKGIFSYRDFYARRAKRIFPALIVVLASVWIAGWLRLFPDEYRQLGEHITAGATFVTNFVLRMQAGYFDNASEAKPLLHLWSLSIEEQFYILWPVLLAVVVRRFGSHLAVLCTLVVIAGLSFIGNIATIDATPAFTFFSPLTRFWELMIGGLLAYGMFAKAHWFEVFREARSLCGCVLLFAGIFGLSASVPYPGVYALLPTVGAFLVISAGPGPLFNRWVLSHPAVIWVGRISYPLYLWHWPFLSFLAIPRTEASSPWQVRIAAMAASFLLAWLTYRFVETPIRRSASLRTLPLAIAAALAFMGVVGWVTYEQNGLAWRLGAAGDYVAQFDEGRPEQRYRTNNGIDAKFREECNFFDVAQWKAGRSTDAARASIDASCYQKPAGTTRSVLIWGDSHAEHLNWGLRKLLPADVALLQVATSGCAANLVAEQPRMTTSCARSNQFALETIRKQKPDVVVIAQWGGHDLPRLRTIARELTRIGVAHVVVVGPVPQWRPALDKTIAAHYWPTPPDRLDRYLDENIVALEHSLATSLAPPEPFVYVDLGAALCNAQGCRTYIDGDWHDALMTFDYGHFTPRASEFVARTILGPTILPMLRSPAAATAQPPTDQP